MKKSEIYKVAQCAVLEANYSKLVKLEVLRELMGREDLAKFTEEREEKED